MATTSTRPMTFKEFEKLPDDRPGHRYELRHGEPFLVAPPKHDHYMIRQRLREVEVHIPDGHSITYKAGQEIPLFFVETHGGSPRVCRRNLRLGLL